MALDAIQCRQHCGRIGDFEDFSPHTSVAGWHGGGINSEVEELSVNRAATDELQEIIDACARCPVKPCPEGAVEENLLWLRRIGQGTETWYLETKFCRLRTF